MKYVMFAIQVAGVTQNVPVVFPNSLVHADVAKALLAGPLKGYTPVSAGEGLISSEALHGKSTTLGLVARESLDTVILNTNDYLHGLLEPDSEPPKAQPPKPGPMPGWSI